MLGSFLVIRELRKIHITICILTYREWCGFIAIVYPEGPVLTKSSIPQPWKDLAEVDRRLMGKVDVLE